MKLTQFTYRGKDWKLSAPINLHEVNLLVGKNAVGKSRIIRALRNVLLYLMQLSEREGVLDMFYSKLLFKDGDDTISYEFHFKDAVVLSELLTVNNEILLYRNENKTELRGELINPPSNKLALHVRRDVVQYPFIEKSCYGRNMLVAYVLMK